MKSVLKNKTRIKFMLFCAVLTLLSCHSEVSLEAIKLIFEVESFDPLKSEMQVKFTLENQSDQSLTGGSWELHWNQIRGFVDAKSLPEGIDFEWVNGEHYFILTFDEEWSLSPGQTLTIPMKQDGIMDRLAMGPMGAFIVQNGQAYDIETEILWKNATGLEGLQIPTAADRYAALEGLKHLDKEKLGWVIPTPATQNFSSEFRSKDSLWVVAIDEVFKSSKRKIEPLISRFFTIPIQWSTTGANLIIEHNQNLIKEAYTLKIDKKEIMIEAFDNQGLVYALQSLRQIVNTASIEKTDWPEVLIKDVPRYGHRGFMLDIARNFHDANKIKDVLDLMSLFKLNYLDLRMSDDEGWRIEIPGLPELTSVGSERGYSSQNNEKLIPAYGSGANGGLTRNGYLTKEEFISILKHAQMLEIKVMPQFGFPSHARAAIKAMDARYEKYVALGDQAAADEFYLADPKDESDYRSAQRYNDNIICICSEGLYNLFQKVVDEMVVMYDTAQIPLERLSIGADELPYQVWKASPICDEFLSNNDLGITNIDEVYNYSLNRMKTILEERQIQMAAWEDVLLERSDKSQSETKIKDEKFDYGIIPYVWNNSWGEGREDMIYKFANLGFQTVMSNSSAFYFDMTDDKDIENNGLSWSGYVSYKESWGTDPDNVFANLSLNKKHNMTADYIESKEKLSEKGRNNFLGIQAQLWTETVRSSSILEELFFPNLAFFSERAWTPQPFWTREKEMVKQKQLLNKQWNRLTNTLGQRTLPMINRLHPDWDFHLPKPGAIISDELLHVRVQFPGMSVRYTTDGKIPTNQSILFTEPVKIEAGEKIKLRTFDSNGRGGRTITIN